MEVNPVALMIFEHNSQKRERLAEILWHCLKMGEKKEGQSVKSVYTYLLI
jgi:hypothetical protein